MGHTPRDASLLVRSERNLWRAGDFGVVVLGPAADRPVTLDGTGAAVWDALAAPRRPGELIDALARAFDTDADRVAGDVDRLVDELVSLGIVEIRS